jgi:lipopolysaccharide export system protein LptA
MKRWAFAALALLMCAAAAPEKQQRKVVLDAPVIDREPDPNVPGASIWKASGKVTLTTSDAVVTADTMVVNVDEKGALKQMQAFNNVTIQGSRKTPEGIEQRFNATCNQATYFIAEARLVLSGDVRGTVVEAQRDRTWDLASEKATVWLREDKWKLERVKVTFTEPEQAPAKQE